MTTPSSLDRARGALIGLAVGDAVGTTLEFSPPGSFTPIIDMVGGGPFNLEPGQWTDDTSMAMCLAESLVQQRGFDPHDQLRRYLNWWRYGYWSSTGTCFDIGNATAASLRRFESHPEAPYPGDAFPDAAGNGPLMRLAPVPIAYALDMKAVAEISALSARATHGARVAIDATRFFGILLCAALNGTPKSELLRQGAIYTPPHISFDEPDALHPEVVRVARGSYLNRRPPDIRGGGYVVDALDAALWAVAHNDTYAATVLAAANLGDDADTTAAIAGQLAGALYGIDAIPEPWLRRLHRHDDILALADALHEMGRSLYA